MHPLIRNLLAAALCIACSGKAFSQGATDNPDKNLEKELAEKDSILFDIAFHSCKVQDLPRLFTTDFIFFHDKGLYQQTYAQPYADFLKNIANGCAAKNKPAMRREIVKGTLQVFTLNATNAVQTGVQRFYVNQDGKDKMIEESKFTRHWRKDQHTWKMTDETDYLVNANPEATAGRYGPEPYITASEELHRTVVQLDSLFFSTYNHCQLSLMDSLTAEDVEFYHDRGGLTTSKQELMAAVEKNICGKVTRTLTPGSIEVYEIPGYGAVEFGYHSFRNIAEAGESHPSKFVTIWRLKEGRWQMTRVISLH